MNMASKRLAAGTAALAVLSGIANAANVHALHEALTWSLVLCGVAYGALRALIASRSRPRSVSELLAIAAGVVTRQ
jgi:uncharacterized membrane protein YfcA